MSWQLYSAGSADLGGNTVCAQSARRSGKTQAQHAVTFASGLQVQGLGFRCSAHRSDDGGCGDDIVAAVALRYRQAGVQLLDDLAGSVESLVPAVGCSSTQVLT